MTSTFIFGTPVSLASLCGGTAIAVSLSESAAECPATLRPWLFRVSVNNLFKSCWSYELANWFCLLEVRGLEAVASFGLIVIWFLILISVGLIIAIIPLLGVL